MKNFTFYVYAFMTASAVFVSSCSDDDDDNPTASVKQILAVVKSEPNEAEHDSIVFSYNTNGELVQTDEYLVSGSSITKTGENKFTYKTGKLVSVETFEREGSAMVKSDKDSISYDDNNRIEKIFDFSVADDEFVLNDYTTIVTYNDNSSLPSRYTFDTYGYQDYEYDARNNIVKLKDYDNGVLDGIDIYTYDTRKNPFKGNYLMVNELEFFNTNNILTVTGEDYRQVRTYEYNSEGYPTKTTLVETYPDSTEEYSYTLKIYYK
ncbi:MAG: hypothetical protein QM786_08520 [Breznakibacter sp.]